MRRAGDVQIGVVADDGRALPAQFQRHRGQVAGRSLHDQPADATATGVEDVVPALGQQRRRRAGVAFDDGHRFGVEVARDPRGEGGRGGWAQLRRLAAHRVTGCDGIGHGEQEQLDGIVPGGDDQHGAQWLGDDAGPAGLDLAGYPDRRRGRPPLEVPA